MAIANLSDVLAKAFAAKGSGDPHHQGVQEKRIPPLSPMQGSFGRWDPNMDME